MRVALTLRGASVQIEAVGPEPHKVFRLEAVQVTLPKWGRMCEWTPHDDAMLLLGIYWCAPRQCALTSMHLPCAFSNHVPTRRRSHLIVDIAMVINIL
jgi:hypothetical protein